MPRPSSAVTDGAASTRAAPRERLRRRLAGDLDTIVLKALEPDAERRYPTAAALLDDLRRHRTGFPVRARPAGGAYRARAFVLRNRWPVAGAVALFALLAATSVVTTLQEARTRRALALATAEAAKARQVTRFVTSLLQGADPFRTGATSLTDLLALGEDRLDRELAAQPEVRVEMLRTLADVQRNLGRRAQADSVLRRAVAERRRLAGAAPVRDAELARLRTDFGRIRRMRSDARGADTLLTEALATFAVLGGDAADEATALYELGVTRRLLSRPDDAEGLLRRALALQRALPDAAPDAAATLAELSLSRMDAGDLPGSEALRREGIALLERAFGPDHPRVARPREFLAGFLMTAGRLEEAEREGRRALGIARRHLAPGHPELLTISSTLSLILVARGDLDAAERLQREVLAERRRLLGEETRDVAGSLYVLGRTRMLRGDAAGAAALMTRALATYDRVSGARDPDARPVIADLAALAHAA
ncbi:tetratricopeptide repeat protein, partial [Roseisolibacter sp. H3M3-2]|uniref:tetratricopeptide repeat protein n=1 Tax=Roseisolibacter sp. H3M3-2 TaxID=3031323 RepID=UPI0023DA2302